MNDKCVFCGRPSSEARFMVKGPGDKNLCNDCISVVSIIANQAMLSMDNIPGIMQHHLKKILKTYSAGKSFLLIWMILKRNFLSLPKNRSL